MKARNKRTLHVDLRCLQQINFRDRGVGRHIRTLLSVIPDQLRESLVVRGLHAKDLPELSVADRGLVDDLDVKPSFKSGDIYLNPIPLNNGDGWIIPANAGIVKVGIIHDFIAHQYPGLVDRLEDVDAFSRNVNIIRKYDLLLPNSRDTEYWTHKIIGTTIPTFVTGVIVDDVFFARDLKNNKDEPDCRFFVVAAGDNPRKNAECALRAFGKISRTHPDTKMLICGGYDDEGIQALKCRVGSAADVDWGRVSFQPWISDLQLAELYRKATAVIVPSFIEGFSIPVVEAVATGGLVVASSCAVHRELIAEPLFDPSSPDELAGLMSRALNEPMWREGQISQQTGGADRFRGKLVGSKAWRAICSATSVFNPNSPAVLKTGQKGSKPHLLFVTPYPPEKTGVATFHAASMPALLAKTDVTVMADAIPRQRMTKFTPRVVHKSDVKVAEFDRVFCVVGNSPYHKQAIDYLLEHGGEMILHDSRLFEYYLSEVGADDTIARLSRMLGRRVGRHELDEWAGDRRKLPTPMLDDVVSASSRTYVFSPTLEATLREMYDVHPIYVPVPLHNPLDFRLLTPEHRRKARAALGFRESEINLCSFGVVDGSKGIFETIYALNEMIQDGLKPHLHLVGPTPDYIHGQLDWARSQIRGSVSFSVHGNVDDETYVNFLLAADVGLQFRKASFGQMSGALTEINSIGLWSVANVGLAKSNASPSFVKTVSDRLEPLNIAYAVADLSNAVDFDVRDLNGAQAFRENRSFENFVRILLSN